MHSGTFATLREAVNFYNQGRGHAVPKNLHLYLHWHITDPHLTDAEVDRIVDFLQALTDETFMPQVPDRVPSGLTPVDAKNRRTVAAASAVSAQRR
jgi:cytochrome c peroxidase